jgi:arabinose-5-phosphate isomerase
VASRLDSPVMRGADVQILLPDAREACPANIAPTTSTTLMLALGDALAVTVMGVRGVSLEKLGALHPGGPIGLNLTPVSGLMRTGDAVELVAPELPMRNVLVGMTEKRLGIAGVVDASGELVGVITDGDLRRHVDRLLTSSAREVMTTHPQTILDTTYAGEALRIMTERRITALFVVTEENPRTPVGLIHIHDLSPPSFG